MKKAAYSQGSLKLKIKEDIETGIKYSKSGSWNLLIILSFILMKEKKWEKLVEKVGKLVILQKKKIV